MTRALPILCVLLALPGGAQAAVPVSGISTHEGQVHFAGDSGAPEAIIRIRHVVWPPPARHRPSLALYVLTPDDMDRAVAYGWADPGGVRIGINQCWMQASCTLASFTLNGAE